MIYWVFPFWKEEVSVRDLAPKCWVVMGIEQQNSGILELPIEGDNVFGSHFG